MPANRCQIQESSSRQHALFSFTIGGLDQAKRDRPLAQHPDLAAADQQSCIFIDPNAKPVRLVVDNTQQSSQPVTLAEVLVNHAARQQVKTLFDDRFGLA